MARITNRFTKGTGLYGCLCCGRRAVGESAGGALRLG